MGKERQELKDGRIVSSRPDGEQPYGREEAFEVIHHVHKYYAVEIQWADFELLHLGERTEVNRVQVG